MKKANLLTLLIILGMVLGALYGQFLLYGGEEAITALHWTKAAGDLVLIRPLKLMVIPLIFFSVVAGITRIGDPSKLGRLGIATLGYYFGTMLIAVVIGTLLVSLVQPGDLPDDVRMSVIAEGQSAFQGDSGLKGKVEGQSMGGAWSNILK